MLAASTALMVVPLAAAEPDTDPALTETQQQLSEIVQKRQQVLAQMSILEPQVEMAQEEYNYAAEQLQHTREQFESATIELNAAQERVDGQRTVFDERLVAIYRTGDYGAVDLFLSTDSVPELIKRLEFLVRIGNRDAEVLHGLATEQQAAEDARDQLAALQQQQTVLELKAAQKKHEAEKKQAELKTLMSSLDQEYLALLDQQATEQQAQQATMLADIRAGNGKYGIVPEAGSPVETAMLYLGVPYVWGGETPKGFDCSGLVLYVFRQHGVQLPHYSRAQFELGVPVSYEELAPADLVFFGSPIHHVGMYIGGGYYLHAPKTGDVVKISKLADRSDFAGARRYPWIHKAVPGAEAGSNTGASDSVE